MCISNVDVSCLQVRGGLGTTMAAGGRQADDGSPGSGLDVYVNQLIGVGGTAGGAFDSSRINMPAVGAGFIRTSAENYRSVGVPQQEMSIGQSGQRAYSTESSAQHFAQSNMEAQEKYRQYYPSPGSGPSASSYSVEESSVGLQRAYTQAAAGTGSVGVTASLAPSNKVHHQQQHSLAQASTASSASSAGQPFVFNYPHSSVAAPPGSLQSPLYHPQQRLQQQQQKPHPSQLSFAQAAQELLSSSASFPHPNH